MPVLLSVLLGALPALELPVPFVHQKPDFCGEAASEMALRSMGQPVTQDDLFEASGVDPLLGRGAWTNELATALRRFGVEPGKTWYRIDPKHAQPQIDAQWQALLDDLRAGQPSIVCMHYDASPKTTEHFRLVTGFDERTDELIFQEPAEADGANRRMKRSDFLGLWTFKPARDRWMLIRLKLPKPSRAVELPTPPSPRTADLSQHVQTLKQTLPKGFTLVWEPPFLVIGDEAPDRVRARAKDVVRWCRDLLLKDYFAEAPASLHEVWVLKDAASYTHVSKSVFSTTPTTPYGYYVSSRRALVMNIKPGYGTLTHELVHPFMHQAWPDAPAWLNEGVASLFEFPYEDAGHLKGRVNWRLPGLQRALPIGAVPTFFELTHLDDDTFYEDPTGVNYAAARYLCFWLQEQGLLVPFVKRALEHKAQDPTAHRALSEVLGGDPDLRRAEWERFVLKLKNR